MGQDSNTRNDGDGGVEKLRADKVLLRRAVIAEREEVAKLRKKVQEEESGKRELMLRVDSLQEDKARLQAVVASLKSEVMREREAASSASLTGGSMFKTLLASADGSVAEFQRLRGQITLLEGELKAQIDNTAKIHDEMVRQKRAHDFEAERLRKQTAQALEAAEEARERMEFATTELEFAKRQNVEIATQREAKAQLATELSHKLQAKTAALHHLENLRRSDLDAARKKFTEKVPFDDSADQNIVHRFAVYPRIVTESRNRSARIRSFHEQARRLSTIILQTLSNLNRLAAPPKVRSALASLCQPLQLAVKRLGLGSCLAQSELQSLAMNALETCESLLQLSESKLASPLREACILLEQFTTNKGRVNDQDSIYSLQKLGQCLQNLSVNFPPDQYIEQEGTSCDDHHDSEELAYQSDSTSAVDANLLDWQDSVLYALHKIGQVALELAQFIRSQIESDESKQSVSQYSAEAAQCMALMRQRAVHSSTSQNNSASETSSEILAQKLVAQTERLETLQSQYDTMCERLTQYEKMSEHNTVMTFQNSTETNNTNASQSHMTSLYESVVINEETGDLEGCLRDVIKLQMLPSASDFELTWIEQAQSDIKAMEIKIQAADARAASMQQNYIEALERNKALATERSSCEESHAKLASDFAIARRKWQEDAAHVRKSYDSQLQHLTSEMMRLQDVEQDYEVEVRRLKAQIEKATLPS